MTSLAPYPRGDRVVLVATDDPGTRLRPGDQGTVLRWDPAQGQLHIRWDSGSSLSMLPGDGDQVRLLARAAGQDGTEPEDLDDGEPAEELRQDITDPATGLSRLLSERCTTCILRRPDAPRPRPDRRVHPAGPRRRLLRGEVTKPSPTETFPATGRRSAADSSTPSGPATC
jgi:hypothetical protein